MIKRIGMVNLKLCILIQMKIKSVNSSLLYTMTIIYALSTYQTKRLLVSNFLHFLKHGVTNNI